ncbi:protein-disulfide reductase DsbD family protein [Alteraurantiacibacter aquimixticola]|uniref:Thiol:disulfide interchange protein n=1 Tax=Alteraurantiacibacter aquimixticola TaxID=2489173 RepID=A0A4T3F0P1_9SPHN|nr:protein-disulfide reductase DsbD domain-containing protein [Alteraurantiacibacter aquimixticola]TIX50609.1 thiol:disulfide interchange protein [Alteraurantiacibacter aquimixticola]
MDHFRYLLAVMLLAAALPAQAQQQNHIAADLVAEAAPVAGEAMQVAFLFRPEEGWHGYWSNPGDAGLGMRLDWNLPEGWEAGEPQYPVPQQLVIAGLMNHVYEHDYAVLVPITVPEGAALANWAPVTVDAEWLACTDQICVPESATLTLRVPQVEGAAEAFDSYRAALPPLIDSAASFALAGDTLRIAIPLPASMDIAAPHVFVAQDRISADRRVAYAEPQVFRRTGDMLVAEVPLAELILPPGSEFSAFDPLEEVTGILAFGEVGNGIRFEAVPGEVPAGGELIGGASGRTIPPLWSLLLAALAGGLLLNLMPCVFPILSLKAMTLARAGESEAQAKREALAYTAGVVLACLALGGLLLLLRAGGEQVGWAFQLQEPGVVVGLLVLAVLITANFAGVFELPSLAITRKGGQASSFATGLLAAFVATPCTGPFMAAALGAALLLPPLPALVLFAALGLGLALPFLLLGFVPALRNRLPKPGPWMERFRKIMAIPMGLTALALLWLLVQVGGRPFALVALALAAGLVLGLMITGRLQRAGKMAWPAFALIAAPFGIFAAFALPATFDSASRSAESLLSPIDYSEAALAEARASGQPVFLWFTADWCVTCKVNEGVALEREATREAFEAAGVIAMRGDWTVRDEEITRFLTQQGVAGVPLYMWYPAGGVGEQLPQVLTPDMLVELAAR